MPSIEIFKISQKEKRDTVKKLIAKSYPGMNFYILIVLSSFLAAMGLIINNIPVLIGSMLIAPLLYPIIFLGMSVVLYDSTVLKRTLTIIGKIIVLGILIGLISAIFVRPFVEIRETGIFPQDSILPVFYIAVFSGLAAAFSIVRESLEEFLPGVAVSIALLPPLINIGVSLGFGNFNALIASLQQFILNVFGIVFASIIIFSLMSFSTERKTATKVIKKEEKCLEKGEIEFKEEK